MTLMRGGACFAAQEPAALPTRVEALVGEVVVQIACGWRHTAALSAARQLYTWGHGGWFKVAPTLPDDSAP